MQSSLPLGPSTCLSSSQYSQPRRQLQLPAAAAQTCASLCNLLLLNAQATQRAGHFHHPQQLTLLNTGSTNTAQDLQQPHCSEPVLRLVGVRADVVIISIAATASKAAAAKAASAI
jgi:hypothetical protein